MSVAIHPHLCQILVEFVLPFELVIQTKKKLVSKVMDLLATLESCSAVSLRAVFQHQDYLFVQRSVLYQQCLQLKHLPRRRKRTLRNNGKAALRFPWGHVLYHLHPSVGHEKQRQQTSSTTGRQPTIATATPLLTTATGASSSSSKTQNTKHARKTRARQTLLCLNIKHKNYQCERLPKMKRQCMRLALLLTPTTLLLPTSSAISIGRLLPLKRPRLTSSKSYSNGNEAGNSKSDFLTELDFEDDDYYDDDDFGDESIRWATSALFRGRGGAVAAAANRRQQLPGLHSGWRRLTKRNNNKLTANSKRWQKQQQKLEDQLHDIKRQKLRQFRKTFRQKQRSFQTSLYNLNSKYNPFFPRPPYNLWQMKSTEQQIIGKTTLTGKLFMLNIIIFGLQTFNPRITSLGAKRSDLLLEGRQLHRLITPIFLHGGIGHLMANSYSLKSMGLNVETAFGASRFLATYLVSGIIGNVVSAIQSPNPAVGASGAIFGLVGAYYTFLSRNQDLFGYRGEMQKASILETIGMNLLLGMTNPMIDNWGHIGGFIGGVGMAYLIGPKLYVARIPTGMDSLDAGGFGVGKVVIDRPTIIFRTPEILDEGLIWMNENAKLISRRIGTSVRGLFNGKNEEVYLLDKGVNYSTIGDIGDDNTIYRTIRQDSVGLEGSNVNVSPTDGFRQDVTELDPVAAKEREKEYEQRKRQQQQRLQQRRRSIPKEGRSIRPQYGHLYR
jgi:membrane associated rhomboid family serine protease